MTAGSSPQQKIKKRTPAEPSIGAEADAIRGFLPDHILIALRSSDHDGWQERGLLDQIREFGIPITVFELDRAGRLPTDVGAAREVVRASRS